MKKIQTDIIQKPDNDSPAAPRRGRPPKKDYDPEAMMRELIDTAAEIYREKGEIKATALELSLPPGKVKKLLITGKVLSYPETEQIQELLRQGRTMTEIQYIMGLGYSTLHTYLPYTKVIYKMSEISQNADGFAHGRTSLGLHHRFSGLPVSYHLRPAFFLYAEDWPQWRIHERTVH